MKSFSFFFFFILQVGAPLHPQLHTSLPLQAHRTTSSKPLPMSCETRTNKTLPKRESLAVKVKDIFHVVFSRLKVCMIRLVFFPSYFCHGVLPFSVLRPGSNARSTEPVSVYLQQSKVVTRNGEKRKKKEFVRLFLLICQVFRLLFQSIRHIFSPTPKAAQGSGIKSYSRPNIIGGVPNNYKVTMNRPTVTFSSRFLEKPFGFPFMAIKSRTSPPWTRHLPLLFQLQL